MKVNVIAVNSDNKKVILDTYYGKYADRTANVMATYFQEELDRYSALRFFKEENMWMNVITEIEE